MKILLVGNGAREHIIAEQIARSAELYAIMSKKNPGIAKLAQKYYLTNITNPEAVGLWAIKEDIDLAFISPDAVLAAGMSDALENADIPIASPVKAAAKIEWDKSYARNLMKKYSISGSPNFELVKTKKDAIRVIKDFCEVAVKPIGLSGGKGVKVSCDHLKNTEEAIAYACELLKKDKQVLIEEKIIGEEFSLQLFSDGKRISLMPPVQDHKRAYNNDCGPNTGGMGSYSTGRLLPFMHQNDIEQGRSISQTIIDALRKEDAQFKGVLYTQLMCTRDGVKLIEFNSRFGDPEAINVLSLLKTQFVEILQSIADENLCRTSFSENATVVKYLVPTGYPDNPIQNSEIFIDEKKIWDCGAKYYHASVYEDKGKIYTTNSRAIAVVGTNNSLENAEEKAEEAIRYVRGQLWHRKDVGTYSLVQRRIENMRKLRQGI
ncbi:MAG: phosphoribosylamine--glycine ligase [Candidatus Micrarchaeota archaeon]